MGTLEVPHNLWPYTGLHEERGIALMRPPGHTGLLYTNTVHLAKSGVPNQDFGSLAYT